MSIEHYPSELNDEAEAIALLLSEIADKTDSEYAIHIPQEEYDRLFNLHNPY